MRDFRGQTERNGGIGTHSRVPSRPLDSTRFDMVRGEMMEAEGQVSRCRSSTHRFRIARKAIEFRVTNE
jgi:hypothetical protein